MINIDETKEALRLIKEIDDQEEKLQREKQGIADSAVKNLYKSIRDFVGEDKPKTDLIYESINLIDEEINLIFRSLPMTSKHLVITMLQESTSSNATQLYITKQHGLKYPYTWSHHRLMDSYDIKSKEVEVIDNNIKVGFKLYKLSELVGNKHCNQERFLGLLAYLKKSIELLKEAVVISDSFKEEKDPENVNSGKDILKAILEFSDYSSIRTCEEVVKLVPAFLKLYPVWKDKTSKFLEDRKKLLTELDEFNKPFKVLLKLSDKKSL